MSKLLLFCLFFLAIVATTAAGDPPPYKITTKRDGDKVGVRAEEDKVTFSVHSPSGIGKAVVERAGEAWPDAVTLRLTGLEHFRVTSGETTLEGSVSLQDGKPVVRLWKGGQEDAPLDAQSPYWMKIGVLGGAGKPATAIPLKGGYFELPLPKSLFEGNPKAVTVDWIDFYRN